MPLTTTTSPFSGFGLSADTFSSVYDMLATPVPLSHAFAAVATVEIARISFIALLNAMSPHMQLNVLETKIQELETILDIALRRHALDDDTLKNAQSRLASFKEYHEDYRFLVASIPYIRDRFMAIVTGKALPIRRCSHEVGEFCGEIAMQIKLPWEVDTSVGLNEKDRLVASDL